MRGRAESLWRAAIVTLPLLASACTLPLDEAARFRAGLPALEGRPVALLERELGPPAGEPPAPGAPRRWGVFVMGFGMPGGECDIEAAVDPADRIRSVAMTGDAYICGDLIARLRKDPRRYAADPTLAAREREESRTMLDRLVAARRELNANSAKDCPPTSRTPPK
ncbi:MAG: hypothetical protein QOJ94_2029 [Sphingomonadales bacterium]|jgi:hypothetical protein|nr:hypothetical protein [Sphingomonadales bacterium]